MAVNVPLILITDLKEQTSPTDDAYLIIGGNDAKKIKVSSIADYLKNQYGIDNIKQDLSEKQDELKDTGWITVDDFANGCTHYGTSDANIVKVRQYGAVVSIQGAFKPTKELATKGYKEVQVFNLPSEIDTPTGAITFVMQGSDMDKFLLKIYPDRKVVVMKYGVSTDSNITVGKWLNATCTYLTS